MAAQSQLLLCVAVLNLLQASLGQETYLIGVGIGDVTGPAAEINMMGYAKMEQKTAGIHLRQFSRAFIFAEPGHPITNRNVFVSVDVGMISVNIKRGVLDRLKETHGNLYRAENVMITATHTHSGVAGFHQYFLYLITSLGFVQESYDNLVTGIVRSVDMAHAEMKLGRIELKKSSLQKSNINRSPASYLHNPAAERAKYFYNTDHDMWMLKLLDTDGKGIGMVNWFAVHAVSMNNTNLLISSDNKGVAQLRFEKAMSQGRDKFVAAFANSNLGDVSPNMNGPTCSDTGNPCDGISSTCPGKDALCFASGPGKDMFESTWRIGSNQHNKAQAMWLDKNVVRVTGQIHARHQYVDMSKETVRVNRTYTVKTCKPAMGYSFAAGTTDGPGAFDFKQGDKTSNILWDTIRDLIAEPSQELVDCQAPKPILLATGEISTPYAWQPTIMDLQMFSIGQFVIVGVPGEFTTMSGRRIRDAVKKSLLENGFTDQVQVVLAGLANDYSSYISTYEEYQVQRYEAASTIFGPHTLGAYIARYTGIAAAIAKGRKLDEGTPPPDLMSDQISLVPPVVMDTAPLGMSFGDVINQVQPTYEQGDLVSVTFVTGHPRNNPQLEGTFLTVEKQEPTDWHIIAQDGSWETKYNWVRTSEMLGHSVAVITWDVPSNQQPGTYRIRHFGHHKEPIIGTIRPFTGTSGVFKIVAKDARQELIRNMTNRYLSWLSNRTVKKGLENRPFHV